MQLTASYTRITARPHHERCLWCFRMIDDLFVEWYTLEDQHRIGKHQAAMDCPYCHRGLALEGQKVTKPDPEIPVLIRDLKQATKWAKLSYPDLRSFLTSKDPEEQSRAEPFRHDYWPEVDV